MTITKQSPKVFEQRFFTAIDLFILFTFCPDNSDIKSIRHEKNEMPGILKVLNHCSLNEHDRE